MFTDISPSDVLWITVAALKKNSFNRFGLGLFALDLQHEIL